MRFLLCCGICLAITAIVSAQTTDSAAQYVDGYRQLAGSLDRCQNALGRIGGLEKELDQCGSNPAPDAFRRIVHELGGEISVLSSERARIRPAMGLARQALRRAAESLGEKAAEGDAAAAGATEDVIKQQQLALSRQYGTIAETMLKVSKEWDIAAKKLDQCGAFLAQSGAVTLEWEKLTELMPLAEAEEGAQAVGQAKTMAKAVAARFSLVPRLKEGLPRLKAALSILGYSVSAASDGPTPVSREPQPVRRLSSYRGTTQGESPAPGSPRGFRGIRGLSTIEELTRTGWLPGYTDSARTPNPSVLRRNSPVPFFSVSPPLLPSYRNLLSWDREYDAPNIGMRFRLVKVGGAAGAQLTRYPAPGSGAAQLLLEPGDIIYNLDFLPIREPVDVMNHHGRTDVSFINVRTGQPQAGVMILPGYTPLPSDVPPERYAGNLGIHYQLIPYADGTLGARLTRTAYGNTPAAALRLELGDMIVRLDGEPIRKPEDVLSHVEQTKVELIDIRTGKLNTALVEVPGQVTR